MVAGGRLHSATAAPTHHWDIGQWWDWSDMRWPAVRIVPGRNWHGVQVVTMIRFIVPLIWATSPMFLMVITPIPGCKSVKARKYTYIITLYYLQWNCIFHRTPSIRWTLQFIRFWEPPHPSVSATCRQTLLRIYTCIHLLFTLSIHI